MISIHLGTVSSQLVNRHKQQWYGWYAWFALLKPLSERKRKWFSVQMNDDSEPLIVRFCQCCWLYCQYCSASEEPPVSVTQAKIYSHSSNKPQLQCAPLSMTGRDEWGSEGHFFLPISSYGRSKNKHRSPWRLPEKLSCTSTLKVWQDSLSRHCSALFYLCCSMWFYLCSAKWLCKPYNFSILPYA